MLDLSNSWPHDESMLYLMLVGLMCMHSVLCKLLAVSQKATLAWVGGGRRL